MRSRFRYFAAAGWLALGVSVFGCTDRLPTLTGPDRLPDGIAPTTLQHLVESLELNLEVNTISGQTRARQSPALFTANDFDGVLNANTIVRFGNFPDTVTVDLQIDTMFTYAGGQLRSTVADTLAVSATNLTFSLWELLEPFDADATWTDADSAGTPWTTPGGTRGEFLGFAFWAQADTAVARDSLVWEIPPSMMAGLAERGTASFLVTLEDGDARAPIGRFAFEAHITPSVVADTMVRIPLFSEAQTFVFDPEPPRPPEVLRVGGITSDRTLLRLTLPNRIPGCPAGIGNGCPDLSPAEVTLNRVELVFDPVPVTSGFRPLAPTRVVVRRLLQPELGERAPLGPIIAIEALPAAPFAAPGAAPLGIPITAAVADAFARELTELALAVQVEPQASTFAYTWFGTTPRLRFVYTLPQQPRLP